ncbi:Protein SUPPRESSOR OF NIM1 1 [Cardamine amara subsp. amara]|uniref:Protein SUPPRESSOR OF NIM1 1 n=1 Tax=Cardamine amara subsp. amara TaxID=228776 RepID=A0ABD0ZPE3_CARAN
MAAPVKLLCELEEEILARLSPQSLLRFRRVCKKWNSLFTDKRFINNHMYHSRPQFIILTESKIYSIDIINHDINSIDPTIELHELPFSNIPSQDRRMNYTTITTCDNLLVFNYRCWKNGTALWNPWLRQVKWVVTKDNKFNVVSLGYDNSRPQKVYKILGFFYTLSKDQQIFAIYECASQALKSIDTPEEDWQIAPFIKQSKVSLNGNLYWITRKLETRFEYFIRSFDFSREVFKPVCLLPCQKNHHRDELILAVYKGDRFSLLKKCYETRKIEIWVTKKKISNDDVDDGEGVVWINLMTLSTYNLPKQFNQVDHRISYFVYDKTLFLCFGDLGRDGIRVACMYIVREDLCKKIQINSGIIQYCRHYVYTPSLISVPSFTG